MGMTPAEVGACSLWAFGRACKGFAKFHGAEDKGGAPSDEAFHRAVAAARQADLQGRGSAG
ncbi:hypothetical protein [uncultured Brevundimonas sp.]|uniref:hypothetical protein n=1 Tax=uncultured Brevundimonas sp. TaxID=213418 RepID=UPI002617400F|nr:hypothetical protein [uncultured Brevundimonas sp.]